jgi:16S rRNA (cytidine1402-2'-O)-methyltransferase
VPTLHIVATPIGNLGDITLRALEVLRSVDVIACEDTRHTRKLLTHYEIHAPVLAYGHDESGASRVLERLRRGDDVALVSDAGTPGLSDPGSAAVAAARAEGFAVIPIPGASALTALLSVVGSSTQGAKFYGFLSPKKGRRRRQLQELLETGEALVVFESPHRVVATLADFATVGATRQLVVGRELTKLHEEILTGDPHSVLTQLHDRPKIQGEFTIFVAARRGRPLRDRGLKLRPVADDKYGGRTVK